MSRTFTRASIGFSLAAVLAACGTDPGGGDAVGGSASSTGAAPSGGGSGSSGTAGSATGATTSVAGTTSEPKAGASSGGAGGSASAAGGAGMAGAAAGGSSSAGAGGATKSAGCGVADHPSSGTLTLDVSGTSREYILKLPDSYAPDTAYKLVFGWHWRGGKASDVASGQIGGGPYYGLEKQANGSTIFVAPNGIDNGWANTGGRDLAFLRAMLDELTSKLCIDQSRIFSTGFSYGGMMSDAIGCDMADVFRAIAPMSGAFYSGCTRSNKQPIALWMSHGKSDDVVPLEDGKDALDLFLAKNGCGAETTPVTPSPCVSYSGCSAGHPVTYCEFEGGHQPPSFASSAIWAFFQQF